MVGRTGCAMVCTTEVTTTTEQIRANNSNIRQGMHWEENQEEESGEEREAERANGVAKIGAMEKAEVELKVCGRVLLEGEEEVGRKGMAGKEGQVGPKELLRLTMEVVGEKEMVKQAMEETVLFAVNQGTSHGVARKERVEHQKEDRKEREKARMAQ